MLVINLPNQINAQDLIEDVLVKRRVDRNDQYKLRSLILQGDISDEDRALIDRILYGVRRGILQLVTTV